MNAFPYIIMAALVILLIGHENEQDRQIASLETQKLPEYAHPVIFWQATALSGSSANNAVVQLEIRNSDGTTTITKIGITDSTETAVSPDWRAISTPTPINSANAFIVWRNSDGSYHCKVQ